MVRSSQQNNHQTIYGKQVVKRNLQNTPTTQVVNGIQQRSSPVPQQQQKQQKLMVVQSTTTKTVTSTSSPTTVNRTSPAENFQKSLPKTIINPPLPPLVTSVNQSASQILKVSSQSFKVPQVFVQQPEKLQQNVQYMKSNSQTNTTHSISNQNSQSSAAIVNSTPQNQNTFISHQDNQQIQKIQNPPSYANAVNNRVSIISTANPQLTFTGASKTFVLPNQQQQLLQSQKSNVIQQVNNENIANHNFQQIKTNASISNGKILYTIPVNSNNPGINQEKVSNGNKSGKPSVGKRKNNIIDGLQETTSKDGKIVILPMKTEIYLNGMQQSLSGSIPSATNNYKKKRNHKSYSSSSQDHFANNKIGNVVTAPVSALTKEWHAPDTYIYDYIGPGKNNSIDSELSVCTQQHWFFSSNSQNGHLNFSESSFSSDSSFKNCDTNQQLLLQQPSFKMLTRDQRLNIKKTNLRRQNMQYWSAQSLRCTKLAQQRLMTVAKILHKLNMTKDEL